MQKAVFSWTDSPRSAPAAPWVNWKKLALPFLASLAQSPVSISLPPLPSVWLLNSL